MVILNGKKIFLKAGIVFGFCRKKIVRYMEFLIFFKKNP